MIGSNIIEKIKKTLIYILLISGSIIMLFPFYWMFISSLKAPDEIIKFPPTLIPSLKYYIKDDKTNSLIRIKILKEDKNIVTAKVIRGNRMGQKIEVPKANIVEKRWMWENYVRAWNAAPFAMYFVNNILMAVGVTLLQILTSLFAAYAFAKMYFPFKKIIFMILVATLMVPGQMLLIPDYIILAKMHWINTYYALIIPLAAQVFGIYFLTQYIETLPQDLFDAAMIDGASVSQILKNVILPLSKTVILTTGLFTFVGTWNSLLWPLIVTNSPEMRTLQVGLAVFRQESGTDWELLTAAATFSIVPLIALFFAVQKQYIEGIARSGLK